MASKSCVYKGTEFSESSNCAMNNTFNQSRLETNSGPTSKPMSSQSVLLIGAGGYIGRAVAQEFLSQKSKFARVAILADLPKVGKFAEISSEGMEVVMGNFLEPNSFKGKHHLLALFSRAQG